MEAWNLNSNIQLLRKYIIVMANAAAFLVTIEILVLLIDYLHRLNF